MFHLNFTSSFPQSWGLSENDYKPEHYCKNASVLQVQYYSSIAKFSYQNIFPYLEGFFTSTTYVVLNIVNSTFVTFLLIEKFLHVSRCWGVRALVLWVTKSLKFPHYHSEYCHTLILLSIRIVQQQSASGISSYLTFRCYHFEKLWVPCPWEVQWRHHCGSISANEYHQKDQMLG